MFSPRKGKQTTFVYGPEIYEKLVSRDHLLYKINESVDFTFIKKNVVIFILKIWEDL